MRNILNAILKSKNGFRLVMPVAVLCLLGTTTLLSSARTQTASVTIVNNSSWEIRHLYLSPADNDNWGPDQLNENPISPGESFTLNNLSCDQSSMRVISEDTDGCFLSNPIACTGNTVWTITNDAMPNCGN
jgi:hypothetical protein